MLHKLMAYSVELENAVAVFNYIAVYPQYSAVNVPHDSVYYNSHCSRDLSSMW